MKCWPNLVNLYKSWFESCSSLVKHGQTCSHTSQTSADAWCLFQAGNQQQWRPADKRTKCAILQNGQYDGLNVRSNMPCLWHSDHACDCLVEPVPASFTLFRGVTLRRPPISAPILILVLVVREPFRPTVPFRPSGPSQARTPSLPVINGICQVSCRALSFSRSNPVRGYKQSKDLSCLSSQGS